MPNSKQTLPRLRNWSPKFAPQELKRLSGTRQFEQGFRMQAITDGELMFPSFKTCFQSELVLSTVIQRRLPTYVGVDLAGDKRPGNAIVAVALDPLTQRRIPVEARYGAWKSPETARHITQVFMTHAVEYVMVENNAYQEAIIDWVQEDKSKFPWWTKVEGYTTGRGKADPQYGLPGLEVEFKNKAWAIASGDIEAHLEKENTCDCGWCEWARQIAMYPRGMATDMVMATWFALNAINKWGRTGGSVGNLSALNYR